MDHLRRSLLNHYTAQPLDRKAERRTDSEWIAEMASHPDAAVVPVWRGRCLIAGTEDAPEPGLLGMDQANEHAGRFGPVFLGLDAEQPRFAMLLDASSDAAGDFLEASGELTDLRVVGRTLTQPQASMVAHAKAICDWQERHGYCPRCGSETMSVDAGHVLKCTDSACGRSHFPRMDSAIIVRVVYEDRILLGRQAVWAPHQYSVVAGFLEPGETMEQAVVREVMEETGVPVSEVHYQSSQPWPFPGNIMLGFAAVASADEISLNDNELEDARWFTRDQIVQGLHERTLRVPPMISISFRLIEHWFNDGSETSLKAVTDAAGYEWTPPPVSHQ